MFEELNLAIRDEVVQILFHAELAPEDAAELQQMQEAQGVDGGGALAYEHESLAGSEAIAAAGLTALGGDGAGTATAGALAAGGGSVATRQRVTAAHEKIGRNDPCWCGSGKKFKKCHGA
jgi:preprotein translocase subunit SecA